MATAMLLTLAGACLAQQATEPIVGTVTFRDGRTMTGEIKVAELGIAAGSGIGTLLKDGGYFAVKVGDTVHKVAAKDLAVLEAQWENTGTDAQPNWLVTQLRITTKDGTRYVGAPAWPPVHASSVEIGSQQVYAFPLAGVDFSPDNFLVKIDLTGGKPVPAAPSAPEEAPAEQPSAPPTTTQPPAEQAPAETAPEAPAATAPSPAAPAATAETGATGPASAQPAAAGGTQPTVVIQTGGEQLSLGTAVLVVKCPNCGKVIRIEIKVVTDTDSEQ